jgi:ADP-ribose pyrophosphatase YjhB (NUDIX family)
MPNRPRRVGVVAFVVRDQSLLLECRADFGTWGVPGGALDEFETIEQGVAREVREETGLEVVSRELFGIFSDPSRIIEHTDGNIHRLLRVAFVVGVATGDRASARSPWSFASSRSAGCASSRSGRRSRRSSMRSRRARSTGGRLSEIRGTTTLVGLLHRTGTARPPRPRTRRPARLRLRRRPGAFRPPFDCRDDSGPVEARTTADPLDGSR